ncbi:hypothetical protein ACSMEB_14015 [Stenotrophomonas maltophilia]|uniref:hypothetical protein n=1 Tax=Stenotrophomonas TaxID=40323 RepID=UPI0013767C04|nr:MULTISPECIES: hypothetical protein [Stenotrophomonas]UQA24395.1 hypothetical protein M1L61_09575 [Stenotrophomonas sp. NY11291]
MEESKTVVVYRLITSRLVDTRQSYAISKALNLALGEDSPRRLTDRLSGLEDVTLPILWSCQLATFVGLVAVLEDSKGSASIPELARLIRADGTEVPAELEAEAAVIYEKYRVFRNKLFSHNSTQREQHRELFDEAKISWEQLDADFDAVTRILFQIADKNRELSLDLAPLMAFNDVEATETCIKKILSELGA